MITAYKMTLEDVLSFQQDMISHSNQHKKSRKIWLTVMSIPAFLLGYFTTTFILPRSESIVLFLLTVIGVGILFALLLRPLLKDLYAPFVLRQFRLVNKDSAWPTDITLQLSDTHVEMHVVRGKINRTTQVPWTSILKVNENETHRFLYYEEDEALIIPKVKDGVTAVEQSEIERILDKHMNTEKHTSSH
ncbi:MULTISPECIES: YcxB family protein [Exiguobacterium]|uniref:YcxB family protein n=1 Tax=Exiguobacterium TaxID=33986 RepID=UPI001BEAE24A|nr:MULTISPECIES: YcxB family protein [Exiguobacterium]MCT4787884.1 YcxB family protein [Exiguobacterium mexicanum]